MKSVNLHDYDLVIVNTSGGKDSQTQMRKLVNMAADQDYPLDQMIAVHADLRRVEWKGSKEIAEEQARIHGLRFEWITRELGDLIDQVLDRGMWPSSSARFCTSDHKRDQVQKVIVREGKELDKKQIRILNCMGMRAEESPARAKKQVFSVNKRATTKTRHVDDYLPIHDWLETEVWADIHESSVPHHWAYDKGMSRLSCVFCIFASESDLMIAGRHNPELLDLYCEVEETIDHTFKSGMKIADIRDAIRNEAA